MKLYSASLNWYGGIHNLYTYAWSEADACEKFFRKLAKRVGVKAGVVFQYYKQRGDGYKVKEEKNSEMTFQVVKTHFS